MSIEIGRIETLHRYPVKSMRGQPLESIALGWHGLEGDRRFAFRRSDDYSGFPWLTAGRVPRLVLYTPHGDDEAPREIVSPSGARMPLFSDALAVEIGRCCEAPVEMMQLKQGIFDDASVSIITVDTVSEVGRLAGRAPDVRRFRPNIVIRSANGVPFEENEWVGGTLTFGEDGHAPAIAVTMRDLRCAMINIDPDHGTMDPLMLKAVVGANQNCAGAYATVTRAGFLAVGQTVFLHR